jgi:hypothetical protein
MTTTTVYSGVTTTSGAYNISFTQAASVTYAIFPYSYFTLSGRKAVKKHSNGEHHVFVLDYMGRTLLITRGLWFYGKVLFDQAPNLPYGFLVRCLTKYGDPACLTRKVIPVVDAKQGKQRQRNPIQMYKVGNELPKDIEERLYEGLHQVA